MIYKVCDQTAWAAAETAGSYAGSGDDRRDGYIHFSTAAQLPGTLAKYYAGRADLVLAAVDPGRLGAELKWEPARAGDLFPHLYRPLRPAEVVWVQPLTLGADGRHILPQRQLLPQGQNLLPEGQV